MPVDFDYEQAARLLWGLLDNIDTLDDMVRGDDAAFRRLAREYMIKRHKVLSSDGYSLSQTSQGELDKLEIELNAEQDEAEEIAKT